MGTSGGGAGGGSSGSGGGGGTVTIVGGSLREVDPKEKEAWQALQQIYSELSGDYLRFIATDTGVVAAYEALHRLHVMLVQEHSWDNVEKSFGVTGGSGCLRKLADALSAEDGPYAVHPRLSAPLHSALMDFFTRMVGDNILVRNTGDSASVLSHLTPSVFQSTSALFLGNYLAETLRHEELSLSRLARSRLTRFSEAKANQVVASFMAKYKDQPWGKITQVSYRNLFQVIQGEPEWLAEQLRKEVRYQGQASSAKQ